MPDYDQYDLRSEENMVLSCFNNVSKWFMLSIGVRELENCFDKNSSSILADSSAFITGIRWS